MMKNTKRVVASLALLLFAVSAMADLKSDTQRQFDLYCSAVKAKDPKAIEKVLRANFSPDFQFVPKKGKAVDLSTWIADEKMQSAWTQSVKAVSLHVDSLKMGKGAATMQVTLSYEGITKIDPKGKAGILKYVATTDQTMVRKNGKWWITMVKEVNSQTLFNGKLVGM